MYRRDPITGDERLVAPSRAARLGVAGPGCPFCGGHEAATPHATGMRARRDTTPTDAPWGARSFPNLFPLTDPHEVVVPTPAHVTSWRELALPELQDALGLLFERRRALLAPSRYVHAFANDGEAAGASISHVHAQIVALERSSRTDQLTHGVRDPGSCAACSLLEPDNELLVERGLHHSIVAHPVPRMAGALLVVPHTHQSEPSDEHLAELADLLHRARAAADPTLAVNWWLVADEQRGAHWYLELQPRSANLAGVELALGLSISAADAAVTASDARERLAMRR